MKFCPNCERVMIRRAGLMFECSCGEKLMGDPSDAQIASSKEGETIEMYRSLIKNAAFDQTNQFVKKDCPQCHRDYMVQLRIGPSEKIIYKCKCGYEK